MPRFKGFVGTSYNLRNTQFDCQRTVNWYPEVNEIGLGKEAEVTQLVPTPGLYPLIGADNATTLETNSRGGFVTSTNKLVWVFGQTLYLIGASTTLEGWSARAIYTQIRGMSECFFADNGIDLFVLSDGNGYAINLDTGTTVVLSGGGWASASSMTYYDTYLVFSEAGTNRFFWTDPLSTTVDALSFASAETNTDNIVGLINNAEDLWIFGTKTTEIWYNYGANNIVFARRPSSSGMIELGCASARTVKKLNGTIFWLSQDDRGGPMLVMANGMTPQRVSTHPIEQAWMKYSATEFQNATAYTYQWGGHHFYCLNIPGQTSTWVYDMTASLQLGSPTWHERTSRNLIGPSVYNGQRQLNDAMTNTQNRHWAQGHAFYAGRHITGGYADRCLYAMDEDTYTDNGQAILRERTTPHISNSMDRVFYSCLTLDILTGATPTLDTEPKLIMQFSDDGGFTWSDERYETSGHRGDYALKVQFPRLGCARNRVFRIRCTDANYWAISGATIDLKSGWN